MSSIKPTDIKAVREQLAGKQGVGYWRSLAELAGSPAYRALAQGEFPDEAHLWQAPISRRSILKLLGASMALAGLTGCSRQPDEHIVPYVNMPEHMVPGNARYYATSALIGGYAHGLLAESHEGRPTKVEGNPDHPATLGACDAISQSSVLSLYDPDRASSVRHNGTISSFGKCLMALKRRQRQWDNSEGRGLCFLTETITSPSEIARIRELRERWPQARWFVHEPVDRRGGFAGSELLFGQMLEPRYRLDQARVVLSLDADFMQSQPGFLRYARDFMLRRRAPDHHSPLSDIPRLYALESSPALTGAAADHRLALTYYDIEPATRQLANALGLDVPPPPRNVVPEHWINALARDLQDSPRGALVIPGDQQPASVHAIAHAINERLGAFGHTVEWMQPVADQPNAPDLSGLTRAIHSGEVDSLIVLDANPIYSAPADLAFTEAFKQVPWRLHWGSYNDETGRLSHWHIPAVHALESWADARAYDGTVGLVQPLIHPLHGGKTALQMLEGIDRAVDTDPRTLLMDYWRSRHTGADFDHFWRQSLHDGVVRDTRAPSVSAASTGGWRQRLPGLPEDVAPAAAEFILQFRPDPALWDGRYANNGWLQEMPRPITTLTWDNALLISPAVAEEHGLDDGDMVELATDTHRLKISVKVPVFVLPRQPARAVTLTLGHGRYEAGQVAQGVGTNAYALRTSGSPWALPVTMRATGERRELAAIQVHNNIEGRDLVRGASLEEYRSNPTFAQEAHHELSLYPEPWPGKTRDKHAWGMAIDLSACIGCNACVTACQAENNIPIVGPDEVSRGHDMHWIRVDRYFSGGPDMPGITFQPVPCMHCENAPCEYVCPVGATQHSADGLNQMIYQRCVGTRYCSQNCPYKVRRFNWFDYTSAVAAYPAEPAVQNPDVTVRSRGVMEKCTYCVQRISRVRQQAEGEGRAITQDELQTACQQACPTEAIVFGDLMDKASDVSRLKAHPLNYAMLAQLNTRPRTTYLAAINNPNPELTDEEAKG